MTQNELAPCQQIGTELTRGCSRDVRSGLLVQRRLVGADSFEGRRMSMLDEMLQAREAAEGDQLANLNRDIPLKVAELAALMSKGDLA